MEGVEKIIQVILEDAGLEAQSIREEGERRAEAVRQAAQADVAREKERMERKAEQESLEREHHAATTADLERRRMQLSMRQDVVEQVFQRVLEAMQTLPRDTKRAYLMRLMLDAVTSGQEEVLAGASETCLDEPFIAEANRLLQAAGRTGTLRLSPERAHIAGGFLLREHGIITNCSFDMIVRQQRPKLERAVLDKLFA